ncbi:tumor necrosis factor receptor superfamily member 6B-like [Pseudoliparis swirei]|uniref:tumor necrosis factor receptor superfamily member 6B-like n=1 Tax=Pseudoliparis swirei TaxID=2059687 RepID=UPI0024BDDEEB|nr:tumor necrosis factor receptor superfamily member 6B-like [Pseudoliparis swirei]
MLWSSLLPLALLLAARAARVAGAAAPPPPPTYRDTDPVTGHSVECARCAPGTYLRSSCTATRGSVCAPCPSGSFTELWNYIGKCLRCRVCGRDQVAATPCAADSDCRCACRPGYFKRDHGMCHRHRECPAGQGVLSKGSPDRDTACGACSNGTFSAAVSTHAGCAAHAACGAAGERKLLSGGSWHDSVCTSCRSRDGGDYLREILPSFFVHQKIHAKRLRRILHKLPPSGTKRGASGLDPSDLRGRIDTWAATATAAQIREVPAVLTRTGADGAGERLRNKLQRIDSNLKELCGPSNEVERSIA